MRRAWGTVVVVGALVGGGISGQAARARPLHRPGDAFGSAPEIAVDGHLHLRRGEQAVCEAVGGICMRAVAPATRSAPSMALASTISGVGKGAPIALVERTAASHEAPWVVDLDAHLRRPACNGNALFVLYDAEDPGAIAAREVTALFQTNVIAGKSIAARMTITIDDGIRAGHAYTLQIVQLIAGQQVVLAEGQVVLL